MKKIDLRRSEYFLKLSKTLNFSTAAKELGVSQPGLTKAINQLETDLGAKLIRREGRNTHLTPVGTALLNHFEKLVMVAQSVEDAANKIVHGDMPVLRLGIMCTIGAEPVSQFLSWFQKNNRNLEVTVKTYDQSGLTDVMLSGGIDAAIVGTPIDAQEQQFRYRSLYEERMVVASAPDHNFAKMPSVLLEDVAREYNIDRIQCEFREVYAYEFIARSFEPKYALRCENEDLVLSLVAGGAGVAILPENLVGKSGLAISEISDLDITRTVSLAVPFGREDTKFINIFLKAAEAFDWSSA